MQLDLQKFQNKLNSEFNINENISFTELCSMQGGYFEEVPQSFADTSNQLYAFLHADLNETQIYDITCEHSTDGNRVICLDLLKDFFEKSEKKLPENKLKKKNWLIAKKLFQAHYETNWYGFSKDKFNNIIRGEN